MVMAKTKEPVMPKIVINLKEGDPVVIDFDTVEKAKARILFSVREYSGFWSDEDQIWIPNSEIKSIQITGVDAGGPDDRPSPDPEKVKARQERLQKQANEGPVANAPVNPKANPPHDKEGNEVHVSDPMMEGEHDPRHDHLAKKDVVSREDVLG
jgi:hypothetical protein